MARPTKPTKPSTAATYRHPESQSPLRPDVGTQAQFKKRKPPTTYRYDSSLSPELDWDGENPAREQGEALIQRVLDAKTLEDAKAAAAGLKALGRPFLNWSGKAERGAFELPTLPLFVHERLSGAFEVVWRGPRLNLFDQHWLAPDRDGQVLLFASSAKLGKHATVRFSARAFELGTTRPTLLRFGNHKLVGEPLVDAGGYQYVAVTRNGLLKGYRLETLGEQPGPGIDLGKCM